MRAGPGLSVKADEVDAPGYRKGSVAPNWSPYAGWWFPLSDSFPKLGVDIDVVPLYSGVRTRIRNVCVCVCVFFSNGFAFIALKRLRVALKMGFQERHHPEVH